MRIVNRLLVFTLLVAVTALGFVIAVEAAWTGLGYRFLWFPGKQWLHTLRSTAWSTRSVAIAGASVAVFGLLLLTIEVRPRPKRSAQMSVDGEDVWLLNRRSTEHHLRRVMQNKVSSSSVEAKLRVSREQWRLVLRSKGNEDAQASLAALGNQDLKKLLAPSGSKVTAKVTADQRKR
jgi:hypothetical protein